LTEEGKRARQTNIGKHSIREVASAKALRQEHISLLQEL
jgi:hypothetical protein